MTQAQQDAFSTSGVLPLRINVCLLCLTQIYSVAAVCRQNVGTARRIPVQYQQFQIIVNGPDGFDSKYCFAPFHDNLMIVDFHPILLEVARDTDGKRFVSEHRLWWREPQAEVHDHQLF